MSTTTIGREVVSMTSIGDSSLTLPALSAQPEVHLESAKPQPGLQEKGSVIYIEWERGDSRNPAEFSYSRKWLITITATVLTACSSSLTSSYTMGYPSMIRDLNCSNIQATLGLSVYALGFGLVPLITAPVSEDFGRQPLYLGATFIFALMNLAIALAPNIQAVIVFRFISGAAASAGPTMVGGTVADLFSPEERGLPMAVFSIAGVGGQGLGPLVAGWVEMNPHLEWRWIQWIQLIVIGVYFLIMPFTLQETRSTVLLTKIAKKMRKETGNNAYRARAEDENSSLRERIYISCTRPLYLLFRDPVVAAFSLWFGFAWGILYSLIESVAPAFRQLHNFNQGQIGTVFVTITIGTILGFISNIYQERIYCQKVKTKGQEARLYSACFAAILFPLSQFIYAWTALEGVSWVGMAIGVVLFSWSVYVIYLAVSTYLADCYGPYASSALAAQSLFRNLAGTAFPLFTTQMYTKLTFKWSSTLFACIATLMIPIPFVLYCWGKQIRARSKFASHVPSFGS